MDFGLLFEGAEVGEGERFDVHCWCCLCELLVQYSATNAGNAANRGRRAAAALVLLALPWLGDRVVLQQSVES